MSANNRLDQRAVDPLKRHMFRRTFDRLDRSNHFIRRLQQALHFVHIVFLARRKEFGERFLTTTQNRIDVHSIIRASIHQRHDLLIQIADKRVQCGHQFRRKHRSDSRSHFSRSLVAFRDSFGLALVDRIARVSDAVHSKTLVGKVLRGIRSAAVRNESAPQKLLQDFNQLAQ